MDALERLGKPPSLLGIQVRPAGIEAGIDLREQEAQAWLFERYFTASALLSTKAQRVVDPGARRQLRSRLGPGRGEHVSP